MSVTTSVLERISPPLHSYQPELEISAGNYQVRLVRSAAELDAALRLRFEVFNLELGEGLATSYLTGRDQDQFDSRCQHLIAIDRTNGEVVGTYRLQTLADAGVADGFYTAGEFNLQQMPLEILAESVEIGRACIAVAHRNTQVLMLLWQGLMQFLAANDKRYFFGCCSLTTQKQAEGWALLRSLERQHHLHPTLRVMPKPGFACRLNGEALAETETEPKIPRLFRAYLRFGAKVCGPPAIDRQFRTIDFFVICDTARLTPEKRELLTPA
jgi:putative hemolysin